jgi:hypothetical protein
LPIPSIPVFATLGEPVNPSPLSHRSKKLVIFGTLGRRLPIYQRFIKNLTDLIDILGITEVIDIGAPMHLDLRQIGGVPLVKLGEQPRDVVNQILLDSMVGVISYPPSLLAKSTIFGAYCAYRLVPVVLYERMQEKNLDGLETGTHYWTPAQPMALLKEQHQKIADNALTWYQSHNASRHALLLHQLLTQK